MCKVIFAKSNLSIDYHNQECKKPLVLQQHSYSKHTPHTRTFLLACPNSTAFTLWAKLSEQTVSPRFFSTGATCTTIKVFELPPVMFHYNYENPKLKLVHTKRVLQQISKLWVAIWSVLWPVLEWVNYITKCTERLVDVLSLLQSISFWSRFCHSFTPC